LCRDIKKIYQNRGIIQERRRWGALKNPLEERGRESATPSPPLKLLCCQANIVSQE
jgi:hypothetical protein